MQIWLKRLLLVFEIGGGFLGLAMTAQNLFTSEAEKLVLTPGIGFGLLYLFGIIAGLVLAENERAGILLSLIYHALQVPVFASSYLTYSFSSGFCLNIWLGAESTGTNFYLGSHFAFYVLSEMPWSFGLNLFAVIVFMYLLIIHLRQSAAQKETSFDTGLTDVPDFETPPLRRRLTF